MQAQYKKLKNGDWGVQVDSESVTDGQSVVVTKKSGEQKTETIGKVLWRGNGKALCTVVPRGKVYDPDKFNGYGAKKGGYRKACVSGGNCSSFGSGKSCGGYDCDGY